MLDGSSVLNFLSLVEQLCFTKGEIMTVLFTAMPWGILLNHDQQQTQGLCIPKFIVHFTDIVDM